MDITCRSVHRGSFRTQQHAGVRAALRLSQAFVSLVGHADGVFLPQSPPNHVIPQPEEIYIYCPLGTAFKVKSCESSSKNPSIVTM